jgi:PAS domain S-box-containing protein
MNADPKNPDARFFEGGGEMGELIRTTDWSNTSLGPISGWPVSLKTTLAIMLHSRFPMLLYWGPDLICFYNDAYRSSLGNNSKHPGILGGKAEKAWPEAWHIIGPLTEQVLTGGEATWSEDQLIRVNRNGSTEDAYWTFSCSPVYNERADIAAVLVTCIETTARVNAHAQVEQNEQQLRSTVMQIPLGITILKGPSFIVETVNEAYLNIIGRDRESFTGRSLFDSLPEVKESVEPLLMNVLKTGIPYHGNEFAVPLFRNGQTATGYFNFTYQPLVEPNGEISGVIVMANDITLQVEKRYAFEEREKQFSSMVMQSPIAMTIWKGKDYIIEVANEELMTNIWRKEPHEVLGKKALDVFPELMSQKYPALLARVYNEGIIYREKESIAYVNGNDGLKKFYLDYQYAPLHEHDGSVSGIMITVNNVTEQVEARQKLEDAESRLRLALDATGIATWDLDLRTREIIYSRGISAIFGYPEDVTLTHPQMRERVHPDDLHSIVEPAFEYALQHGLYQYEARITRPDGTAARIKTHGKVIFDQDGTPLRMLGTITDITGQKQSEERSARLAAIVESSDDAIISKTMEGIITSWNKGAQRIFGYTEEEMIGQSIMKLIPDDRQDEESLIIGRIRKGEPVENFVTQRITKHNKIIDVSLTISPLKGPNGKVIGVSKIARDITVQKEAERKISENEERLQVVLEASELGTWEINLLTKEITYSRRYIEMFGITHDQKLTHEELLKYIHPDDLKVRAEAFKKAYATGSLKYQTRLIWDDNSIHWVEGKGKILYDEENRPYKMTGTIRDVTRERMYQERIEESEKRFRTVADTAPVLIWMSDTDGQCIFLNKAWLDYTGRSAEEEVGSGWSEGIHPEDRIRCLLLNEEAYHTRQPFVNEYRLRRADGEYRWVSDSGLPRFTREGIFEGFIGACMDIHDRILFEEKLKESESRLRIAALSSELGTWDYNPATQELRWDNASRELFGVDADVPVTLELFWSHIHPDDRDEALQKMKNALDPAKAEMYDTEYRIIGLPGDKVRWIHAKGKAFFNAEDKPYLFSGTILDVTEKRIALDELQESEQKFRLLADSMPQFIWTGDELGNINYFNRSLYDYTGLTPQQIASEGWLQFIHPDDRAENITRWMYAVSTGEPFLLEHRFRRNDGEYRWQLSRAVPQRDNDGTIQMWVGTSTDIHDQKTFARELEKQVEQRTYELKRSNDELKQSNGELAQFAYVASHDLQEPLRKIQTFSTRILESEHGNLSERGKDYFVRMQSASRRMQQLILDLLSYSRASTSEKHFERVDLNQVVQVVKEQLKESIEQKQATVTSSVLPVLDGIPYQFEQLFTNLISNALKFSRQGVDPVISISYSLVSKKDVPQITAHRANRYHRIQVADNGIGFDPQFSDRIFNVFQRLHGRDEYAGTGIGLSIVKKIVENHHGVVEAHGEVGKGASFILFLPVA